MYLPKTFITEGNFAPVGAGYLVTSATGSLTHERVLATGLNIVFTDGGPGGNFTVHVTGITGGTPVDTGLLAPANASYLTLGLHGALTHERSLVLGDNLVGYDNGANNTYVLAVTGIATGGGPGGGLTFAEVLRISMLGI